MQKQILLGILSSSEFIKTHNVSQELVDYIFELTRIESIKI